MVDKGDIDNPFPECYRKPNTSWEDLSEDFECPVCCVGKDQFSDVKE